MFHFLVKCMFQITFKKSPSQVLLEVTQFISARSHVVYCNRHDTTSFLLDFFDRKLVCRGTKSRVNTLLIECLDESGI